MKKIFNISIITLFLVFCFTFVAYAQKVIMKDGTEYNGNIHHQDDNVIFIVQKESIIKLDKADVKEVVEEDKDKKKIDFLTDDKLEKKESELILQVGYDFYGKYLHKGFEDETDSTKGITFGAKYYHFFIDELGVGGGVNFQTSRELEDIPGKVYFVPAYLSLKLRSNPTEPYKYGYIVGSLGYNFFFPNSDYTNYIENEKGGFFYSLGLGIVYDHMLVELSTAIHNGKANLKSTTYEIDIEYRIYTFSVGYVF